MTTPAKVNKALKAAGLNVLIVRNQRGGAYYYFVEDGFDKVPSLWSYSLAGYTPTQIVEYVQRHLADPDGARREQGLKP